MVFELLEMELLVEAIVAAKGGEMRISWQLGCLGCAVWPRSLECDAGRSARSDLERSRQR